MSFGTLVANIWPFFLVALMLSIAVFPLVYAVSRMYSYLVHRFPRVPPLAFMLVCTLLGVFFSLLMAYLYADFFLNRFFPGSN